MSAMNRRAFTLIEVLIGVLVLALGLLGLGAIIPVVIREQRQAVNTTLGNEAGEAARKYLLSRPDLDPAADFVFDQSRVPWAARATVGWDVWLMDQNWSPRRPVNQQPAPGDQYYLWEPRRVGTSTPNGNFNFDSQTGEFGWHINRQGMGRLEVTIGLADRLWPSESMQGEAYLRPGLDPHRPQFVWDFIGRRVEVRLDPVTGKPVEPEQIQIAIFVRQIDQNIRIPSATHNSPPANGTPITLRDVLLDRLNNSPQSPDRRLPVVSHPASAGPALQYLPTNAGERPGVSPPNNLNYAEPIFIDAQYDPNDPARIEFPNITRNDNAWKLVSQSGQKILDNLGNVYTVRGIPDDLEPGNLGANTEVLIDPPIPGYLPNVNNQNAAGGTIRQVVFTPQIPAAIEVFTITRAVP